MWFFSGICEPLAIPAISRHKLGQECIFYFNFWKSCARRHAKRRYAIYCFAKFLLCFKFKLGWFGEPTSSTLPLKMAMSRFVARYFVLFDLQKRRARFQNLEDVRMTFWRISGRSGTAEQCRTGSEVFVQVESSFSTTSTGASTMATLWEQTGGSSCIYYEHGAGSRTRLWAVPPFLSKSRRPRGITLLRVEFCDWKGTATRAQRKDGTPEVTQILYFQACRGKSNSTKEPNTAGQEFIVSSLYFHIKSYLFTLLLVPYSVVVYQQINRFRLCSAGRPITSIKSNLFTMKLQTTHMWNCLVVLHK